MQLCSSGHDEVAFASTWASDCPACLYAEEVREELQAIINELKEQVEES